MKKYIFIILTITIFAMCNIKANAALLSQNELEEIVDMFYSSVSEWSTADEEWQRNAYPYYVLQTFIKDGVREYILIWGKKPIKITDYYLEQYGKYYFVSGSAEYIEEEDYIKNPFFAIDMAGAKVTSTGIEIEHYSDIKWIQVYPYNENVEDCQVLTNFKLYSFETGEEVFFKAPLSRMARVVEQSIRQQTPMSQIILLIPLAVCLMISYIALRKALAFLLKILWKA